MVSAKRGFSIIELVIVFMIIGVLAAAAFGGLAYLRRAQLSTNFTKLGSVDSLIEQYNSTMGEYPTELRELIEGPSKPQLQRRWQIALATEQELRDAWNEPFIYSLNPKGTQPPYELYSTGPKKDAKIYSPRSREA